MSDERAPDEGSSGNAADLAAQVQSLRYELSAARSWAWAEYHRFWDHGWFPPGWEPGEPGGEWRVPEWLATSSEPAKQDWFVDPRAEQELGDEQ